MYKAPFPLTNKQTNGDSLLGILLLQPMDHIFGRRLGILELELDLAIDDLLEHRSRADLDQCCEIVTLWTHHRVERTRKLRFLRTVTTGLSSQHGCAPSRPSWWKRLRSSSNDFAIACSFSVLGLGGIRVGGVYL